MYILLVIISSFRSFFSDLLFSLDDQPAKRTEILLLMMLNIQLYIEFLRIAEIAI